MKVLDNSGTLHLQELLPLDTSSVVIYSIIPPQTNGAHWNQKFGLKSLKPWRRKAFGKNISQLVNSGDKFDLKIFAKDSFSDEVEVHFNMLCTSMKNRIRGNGEGRDIVTP